MSGKTIFFLFLFSLLIFPAAIFASCVNPQQVGDPPHPACIGYSQKPVTCQNSSHSIPPLGCCDSGSECPASTNPIATGVAAYDNVSLFCNGSIGLIRTALGCIPASNPKALINLLVTWSVSVATGLSLATLFYAGFIMTTAGGDTKKIAQARESITSTVLGLALIALGVMVINFFGMRVFGLGVMGFGV
jgi:hypothetical protein